MVVLAGLLVACLSACSPKRATSASFRCLDADSGWNRAMPLVFAPQYVDSAATYDIVLALRHTNAYRYSNLSLVVDLLGKGQATKQRRKIDFRLADASGNWLGAGFGTMYQTRVPLVQGVRPDNATKVVVWQAMSDVETVDQITEVGIIAVPSH